MIRQSDQLQRTSDELELKAILPIRVPWKTPPKLTEEERKIVFPKKTVSKIREDQKNKRVSVLTQILANEPPPPENPFKIYSKLNGSFLYAVSTKSYLIYLNMLMPDHETDIYMEVEISNNSTVSELVGLALWRCSTDYPSINLRKTESEYGLFRIDEDRRVSWELPFLNPRENVSSYGLRMLALAGYYTDSRSYISIVESPAEIPSTSESRDYDEELRNLYYQHFEAQNHQTFTVFEIDSCGFKRDVTLGICGEKVDMSPIRREDDSFSNGGGTETFPMEDVVSTEIIDSRINNRSIFRLVYYHRSSKSMYNLEDFKHKEFESDTTTTHLLTRKLKAIINEKDSFTRRKYFINVETKSSKESHMVLPLFRKCIEMIKKH